MGELTLEMPHRAPYQGLALIMRLHWPVYVFGTGAALFAATLAKWMDLHPLVSGAIWAGAAFGLLWMCVSLCVSYYVYDHSRMYDWAWLPKILPRFPRRWVNLHAGLDELSPALPVLFPNAQGQVIDMFHPDEMTEPSIQRAREVNGRPVTGQLRAFPQLPLGDETRDTAVLFMVAHEMRRPETRVAFFKELHRVLEKRGTVLVVEHLRNSWNFAAFGPPGYFHFLPDAEWKRVGKEAGFGLNKEEMLTPFVKAFVFEKN